ncbi:ferredoxin [Streptomyces sp. NPDC093085]|uniref:ferredoxin n=1 Tax=Streptomyces sp. NPDC093085 TaxID=3155068 RepID=UPI00343745FB
MIRISVDRERCQGYGNCVLALAGAFDLDAEGLVVLTRRTVDEGDLGAVRRAAYDCPTEAIAFTTDTAPADTAPTDAAPDATGPDVPDGAPHPSGRGPAT